METHKGIEQAQAFIQCHFEPSGRPAPRERLAVTLSRQAGAGAWIVARELAAILDQRAPVEGVRWTVFDKELVEKVLADHKLPARLAEFMPEDRVSFLDDAITELLGLHPPTATLTRATSETILRLAELGGAILIGRGANIVTARLGHVVHVRLVGSVDQRVQRVMELLHQERKAALEFVEKEDRAHQRYVREHFKAEIEDPLNYDLIINTDRISCEQAAGLVADALLAKAGKGPQPRCGA
jgi:hypothetical protein